MKAWGKTGSPTESDHPTSAFELLLYAGTERNLPEPPPWTDDIGPETDYNRLEEYDRLVMNAI